MQDAEIIEMFFAREEQALEEVHKKYGRLCKQVAVNILDNHEEADEAVNTAYERVWNAIPPARPKSLCGYICAAVRNTALNAYDKLKRRSCDDLYSELCEIIPDKRTVESEFDSRQIAELLNVYLAKANKTTRQIFTARYYYNMPISEIARSAGMTESAVKTRLSRTRADLRRYLCEKGVEI